MKRYDFLVTSDVHEAFDKLRNAFLAAEDGSNVAEIINGILTVDEQIKIGRRILVAEMLAKGYVFDDIARELKVGKNTINLVAEKLAKYPECFNLIEGRVAKVESEFSKNAYKKVGGGKRVFKFKKYTGFSRKDVKR